MIGGPRLDQRNHFVFILFPPIFLFEVLSKVVFEKE